MTLLSVVVPVYRVQGYLRECLDSHPRPGVRRPRADRGRRLLAGPQRRDPGRVRRPRPAGPGASPAGERRSRPGPQRRAGRGHRRVRVVRGQRRLAGRRARSARSPTGCGRPTPDVLIVDHDRVFWDGRSRPSAGRRRSPTSRRRLHRCTSGRRLLRDPARGLEQDRTPAICWPARASASSRAGTRTSRSRYPVLVAAERISVLDRVCVQLPAAPGRGDHPDASATGTSRSSRTGRRSFACSTSLGPAAGRPAVRGSFRRMVWHYLIVLGNDERSAARARAGPSSRGRPTTTPATCRRADTRCPAAPTGVKHRLLARRAWWTFATLSAGVRARSAVRAGRRGRRRWARRGAGCGPRRAAGGTGCVGSTTGRPLLLPLDRRLAALRRVLVPRATPATRPPSTRRPASWCPTSAGCGSSAATGCATVPPGVRTWWPAAGLLPRPGPGEVPDQQRQLSELRGASGAGRCTCRPTTARR